MAVVAAQRALASADCDPLDLDAIFVATISPDMPMPSCAVRVQAKLGARRAFAFDLSAACAGSLYALTIADKFIRSGDSRRILVIGAELLTRLVDWTDRSSCVLFGDAAGALVVGPSDDDRRGLLSAHLHSDGEAADLLTISMAGRDVYKFAVRVLPDALMEAFAANGVRPSDIDHVVTHQANLRIVESVLDRVGIPVERCWVNIDRYGNTSSASLPLSLDEAHRAGRLKEGDLIAMMAIGSGMAWGSGLMRW